MPYYQLSPEILTEINKLNLTYSEYRLYLYCLSRDPYAETWVSFTTTEMIQACNFKSAGTLYQAMKKLRSLGLLSHVWDSGKFSTTPTEDQSTIATAIARSLQRSKYVPSDRNSSPAIANSPESTEDKGSENRKSLRSLNSFNEAPRSEFSEDLNPASEDYWQRLYGANQT